MIVACAGEHDRELRAHSLKTLIDRKTLPQSLVELAVERLTDPDPFVRRAAAEVLGAHPSLANIQPLLILRQVTPEDDTHLLHVARMALRDQLQRPDDWPRLE